MKSTIAPPFEKIFKTAQKNGFISLPNDDMLALLPFIKSVNWKNEGRQGPVYVAVDTSSFMKKPKRDPFDFSNDSPSVVRINYANGMKSFDGKYFADWYTEGVANKIAKSLKAKFITG